MRIVMHLDLDAFFAAVEEQKNPELKGKPLVIGADPKHGHGRGVVSTANYEARKYGIYSGQPIAIAYKRCPHAIFLRPRIELYSKVSDRIMALLRKHADSFEQVSIDEAYLDVSKKCKNFEQAKKLAEKIKEEIKKKDGLTCSIGIGPNKLVAKIASDFQKPNGLTVVKPSRVKNFLDPLSVRKIPGIGPKTEQSLQELGVKTIKQLRELSLEQLKHKFGTFGKHIYEAARGIDESPVQENHEVRSVGAQHTFEHDTRDRKLIYSKLHELVNRVHAEVRKQGFSFRTITVKVRYHDFETHTKQLTLEQPELSQVKAYQVAHSLLKPWFKKPKLIRLVGVSFSKLEKEKLLK